jgi:hypothetical protein
MVKRGYFKGRAFHVKHDPDRILTTGAYLNNGDWACHVSLCISSKEIKRRDLYGFPTLEEALQAADRLAAQLAREGWHSLSDFP